MKIPQVEKLLRQETAVVVGCTEPAAIAYATQAARKHRKKPLDLNDFTLRLSVSPEVRRNADTAVVPGLGRRGVRAAAVAGLLSSSSGFNPFADLHPETGQDLFRRRKWLVVETARRGGIYIRAEISGGDESVTAEISGRHDHLTRITRDGEVIHSAAPMAESPLTGLEEIGRLAGRRDKRLESLALDFIRRQVRGDASQGLATELAGLVRSRMVGEPLGVLTFTGSGNQGMFLGVPLRWLWESQGDDALPAAVFALLAQIHLSRIRKRISDDCGLAIKAAPALAGGIAFGQGLSPTGIARVMRNVRRRLEDIDCKGAMPGCGAKAIRCLRAVIEETGVKLS